jgi:hypothetical protein
MNAEGFDPEGKLLEVAPEGGGDDEATLRTLGVREWDSLTADAG